MSNDKLRFELPELHYQTVEVDFSGTIEDALNDAYMQGQGDEIGKPQYEHMLDVDDDFAVRMVDKDGGVLAYYKLDANMRWKKV